MRYVVRAKHVQPDGVGYLTSDGYVTRDARFAQTYASEAEAWDHVALQGPADAGDYWVEELIAH